MASRRTRRRDQARRRRGLRKGIPLGLDPVPEYVEMTMKLTCRKCNKSLDAEEHFYPRKGTQTGYQYECKTCRKEINKKYKKGTGRGRPKGATDKRPRCPRGMAKDREGHREKLIKEAAVRIPLNQPIAESPRTFNFVLRLIIEQQLQAFYFKDIQTPSGRVKAQKVLDDTLFEIRDALTRATHRVKSIERTEAVNGDVLVDVLADQKKRRDALSILHLQEGASLDEIKKSYRKLALVAHPDKGGSAARMSELNRAYTVLMEGANGSPKEAEKCR